MHQDHPNLSGEINRNIRESELAGGIAFDKLPEGSTVKVQTKHTLYTLERRADGDYIQGHPKYCPEPTKANINGSTCGGSMLKMGWLGIGMYLEFGTGAHWRVTTSEIQDVKLMHPAPLAEKGSK